MDISKLTRTLHMTKFKAIKHKEGILHYSGMALVVVGTVMLVAKVTSEKNAKKTIERREVMNNVTPEEKTKVYVDVAKDVVKDIVVPTAVVATGMVLEHCAYKSLKNKNVILTESVAMATAAATACYQRMVNEFGEEKADEIYYGLHDVDVTRDDGNGNITTETIRVYDAHAASPYLKVFSKETSTKWRPSYSENRRTLSNILRWENDTLRSRGYLFLNDVLVDLGMDPVRNGQMAGWTYENRDGTTNYITFKAMELRHLERELCDDPCDVLIDFNVQPNILDDVFNKDY